MKAKIKTSLANLKASKIDLVQVLALSDSRRSERSACWRTSPSTAAESPSARAPRPLQEWAAEFDATTWAQFFLKYVISHPAVTVARVGTTQPAHMLENIGGGIGRLPNEATRKRMAELIDALPPAPPPPKPPAPPPGIALPIAVLDRYVAEYTSESGFTAIIRREGTTLYVKQGTNPEAPLLARSETRFQDPRGPFFDFQVDAQGKVTGANLEQQGPQGRRESRCSESSATISEDD